MANQHTQTCGIAAMMNIFGDRWTWLLVREAFYGASRFTEFQRNTGASRNILTDRLSVLVENGIFETRDVGVHGKRTAYGLTKKGQALLPVMVAMGQWANAFEYGIGKEPVLQIDGETGSPLQSLRFFDADDVEIPLERLKPKPGPGASQATIRRLAQFYDDPNAPTV
ncbi:winged helix-turn-helix transcriptional regulator [uncultured Sulfitobacter sp.]|jgi:DNA-binding HxlR family transcriptional regulator|uniref:winged helix-turn-helix transcriptional regulator n=1 Tax=Sulfitobacter sp. SH22 TaxID=3421172 RepID=UPI0025DCA851|nr:helix-turn-helix domain-containing protein [uncultured Sulfitobacter sp.]